MNESNDIDVNINNIESKTTMSIISSMITSIIVIVFIVITSILLLIIIYKDNINKIANSLSHSIKSRFTESNQFILKVIVLHNIRLIFKYNWWDVNHFKLLLKNHELKLSITLMLNGIIINLSNSLPIKTSQQIYQLL